METCITIEVICDLCGQHLAIRAEEGDHGHKVWRVYPCKCCSGLSVDEGFLSQERIYHGRRVVIACDKRCHKAWGICNRPRWQLSQNEDDYEYLADGELGDAPADPSTYEGGDGKPIPPVLEFNKWCVRECERSSIFEMDEKITLLDFSKRVRGR